MVEVGVAEPEMEELDDAEVVLMSIQQEWDGDGVGQVDLGRSGS